MSKLLFQIIAGILGIWLAQRFVPGVEFLGPIKTLLLVGLILGLINFFIKPISKVITLPLRLLTFGLFSFVVNIAIIVINMATIWIVDVIFPELIVRGIIPLFLTSIIILGLSYLFGLSTSKKKVGVAEE